MAEKKKKNDPEKVHALRRDLQKIADKEFGTDDDGDSRIEVSVLDWTRYRSSPYQPILYDHDLTPEERNYNERMLFLNLSIAAEAVKIWADIRSSKEYDADRRRKKAKTAADSKTLRLCELPHCSTCDHCNDVRGVVDQLGFVHYDSSRHDAPTRVPKEKAKFHTVFEFMVWNCLVTWVPEPFSEKNNPYGKIESPNGLSTRFAFDDGSILMDKPENVQQCVARKVAAILRDKDPLNPVRSLA